MRRILLFGAGGHAQVVADILLRAQQVGEAICPVGYLDENSDLQGVQLLGLPVLGSFQLRETTPHDAVIVAIGDNRVRQRIFEELRREGADFAIARHPSAVIAPDAQIGAGSMICAGAIINPGSVLGENVILNTGSTVDHHNRIGSHAHIAPGVHTGGNVSVGEGTLVGIGATIMPQRQVGSWSVIGAGSLVHKDIPEHVTAVGMPARVVRRRA